MVSHGKRGTMTAKHVLRQQPDDRKMKELILYIATISEGDDYFGATKLNKLLFYADFLAYVNFGESITGHEYQKLENGPAPRRLLPVRDEMERKNEIVIRPTNFYGLEQHRVVALRPYDLSMFSSREIDLVNRLVKLYWDMSATDISNTSHQFIGWRLANLQEIIPYETALLGSRELTDEEVQYARELEPIAARCLSG